MNPYPKVYSLGLLPENAPRCEAEVKEETVRTRPYLTNLRNNITYAELMERRCCHKAKYRIGTDKHYCTRHTGEYLLCEALRRSHRDE